MTHHRNRELSDMTRDEAVLQDWPREKIPTAFF